MAATRAATVDSHDAMQFAARSTVVPASCKTFKVTLRHVGKLPKAAMGHNFVLGKAADVSAIDAAGMKAGSAAGYLKAADVRVIAAITLIGGGETTTVDVPAARLKAGRAYTLFCSFPGPAALVEGSLVLKP